MAINPNEIQPRRNQNLINQVASLFFRRQPGVGPQPGERETTSSGVVSQASKLIYDKYFSTRNDRISIYDDVDELDKVSEETSVVLDTIANNAATSEKGNEANFNVTCKDPKVLASIQGVIARTGLHSLSYSIARNSIKYGDNFIEIVISKNPFQVVKVAQLPPRTMHRNQDVRGNLAVGTPKYDSDGTCQNEPGDCAFEQRDPDSQNLIAAFSKFQIIHGRWNWDGYSAYGKSMLTTTRIIARKLRAEEESLIMGRLVRAMLKLVFYIDTTGLGQKEKMAAIENFKQSILTRSSVDGRQENPYYVLTDFFLSDGHYRVGGEVRQSRTRIETLDPKNEGLVQIDDIKFFHRKLLATLRVPPVYLGFEEDVNAKATVGWQDIQFMRFVRYLQQFLTQMLKDIFDLQLILEGIDPSKVEYEISWPSLQREDEVAASLSMLQQAQAMGVLLGASHANGRPVIDPEFVWREVFDMNDSQVEEMHKRMDALQKEEATQKIDALKAEAEIAPKSAASSPNGIAKKPKQPVEDKPVPPTVSQENMELRNRIQEALKETETPDLASLFQQKEESINDLSDAHAS